LLVLWLGSFLPAAPHELRQWRAPLGYILATSILTALAVHLFKGIVARPRPYELGMAGSSWHGLEGRVLRGWGRGSFPSGHTANAISLLSLCYALHAMCYRKLAWIGGSLVVMFAVAMALSRIMMGAHWPTDTFAAVVLGWSLAHMRFRSWQKKMESKDC
jgi:membrane-associated phospholipid phosphatase